MDKYNGNAGNTNLFRRKAQYLAVFGKMANGESPWKRFKYYYLASLNNFKMISKYPAQ